MRQRVAELNIWLETLDAIAGLPTRYSSKVLGLQPTRRFGRFSLDGLLGALELMLIVVEDAEALARVQRRLEAAPLQQDDHTGWRGPLSEQLAPLPPRLSPCEKIELAAGGFGVPMANPEPAPPARCWPA